MSEPIRLGLIGAGIYMRETHTPALHANGDRYRVVTVYSRTEDSARRVAANFEGPVDVTTDLDALLRRDDIEAVDIALPIALMPDAVERALAAGKHVISEKPAARDLAEARRLLALKARYPGQVWMVAENWRYEGAFEEARALLDVGTIGDVRFAHWAVNILMDEQNVYYHTEWRRAPEFQGGFLLDVGVHHAAALRLILGEIASVSAMAAGIRPDLPPLDTLSAALQFESGVLASYAVTFAAGAPFTPALHILGSKGALRVDRPFIEIVSGGEVVERREMQGRYPRSNARELADFAAVVRGEAPIGRGAPEEALRDLALVEALLRSAETGTAQTVEAV